MECDPREDLEDSDSDDDGDEVPKRVLDVHVMRIY
jgi:hypothetical protein